MSSTGQLLKHYLELALTEAGAGHVVRQPDVQVELTDMADGLDAVNVELAKLNARVARLEQKR
jgi:ubiquinone biosynthesis protein UbiJ